MIGSLFFFSINAQIFIVVLFLNKQICKITGISPILYPASDNGAIMSSSLLSDLGLFSKLVKQLVHFNICVSLFTIFGSLFKTCYVYYVLLFLAVQQIV